jgi:hypothetical protein
MRGRQLHTAQPLRLELLDGTRHARPARCSSLVLALINYLSVRRPCDDVDPVLRFAGAGEKPRSLPFLLKQLINQTLETRSAKLEIGQHEKTGLRRIAATIWREWIDAIPD